MIKYKLMKSSKLITLLIGAILSFPACRETEWDRAETKDRFIDVPVSLGQIDESDDDTRSIVDIEVENFQKAALFAFDAKTGEILTYTPGSGGQTGTAVALFPQQKNFSWSLPTGIKMDIYAIVNYGELDLTSYARPGLKKAELEALRFTSRNPSELKRLETEGYGMPMAGVKKGVYLTSPGDGLEIPVKKLYAKYNLYFDLSRIEQEGWHVQAMHIIVENANTEVPYFVENFRQEDPSKFVEYDRATQNDLDEIQKGGSGHAVTLYMLENCQGHKEGAESWKTVYKDLGFEALRNCTYIDLSIKVNRSNGEYQNLGYAIYLGKTDMRSDFDIVRNLFKTVKIVIPGADDPNPASHFFKFSGTESPTVTPGESIDLYYVTNLPKKDISASCEPSGRMKSTTITYEADAEGIASGYIRFQASEDLKEGESCLVTAGSSTKNATDQRTVTASWPTVLKVDLSEVPTYVAQAGYLRVIPTGGIVRVDAEVKAGSEGILEVREAGVSGSLTNISLAGLAAGKGTVILHHFNVAGVETGSQEVDINIQAPLLRFGMDQYDLSPDGKVKKGMLFYSHPDGTAFYDSDWKRFDPNLVKRLLFPTDWIWVVGCTDYVDAGFARKSDDDMRRLTIPVTFQVKRLYSGGKELQWENGAVIGSVSYAGSPSTNIPCAEASLSILNPFESIAGKCLGVIENNLPVYEALKAEPEYLQALGIQPSLGLRLKSYREGNTFSLKGSTPSLELSLPIKTDLPYEVIGPEEFTIDGQSDKLVLTAVEHPASYTGYGRFPLQARIIHTETGQRSSPVDMGYLEIYLIGAIGPYIHGNGPYEVGGTVIPAGGRSPIEALVSPIVRLRETTSVSSLSGYYKTASGSGYNLYHQSVEIDDHGIDRYANKGETSYLNSYCIRTGAFALGTEVMEFQFGSIWRGHGCGIVDAAMECDRMLVTSFSEGYPTGKLRHFSRAKEKDASGFSYCAVANLFGGNSGPANDIFLEIRE